MTELTDFLKTIADETRLRLLVLLVQREICVCNLCEILEESQPKISRHLSKLRDMGYVRDVRQGQWIFYCLDIKDAVQTEILKTVADNAEKYPVLQSDAQALQKLIKQDRLCKRDA